MWPRLLHAGLKALLFQRCPSIRICVALRKVVWDQWKCRCCRGFPYCTGFNIVLIMIAYKSVQNPPHNSHLYFCRRLTYLPVHGHRLSFSATALCSTRPNVVPNGEHLDSPGKHLLVYVDWNMDSPATESRHCLMRFSTCSSCRLHVQAVTSFDYPPCTDSPALSHYKGWCAPGYVFRRTKNLVENIGVNERASGTVVARPSPMREVRGSSPIRDKDFRVHMRRPNYLGLVTLTSFG
jgi:hypothetical protein